jgi:WD40 repeat protein
MFRSSRAPENKLRLAWKASIPDHVIGVSWSADGEHLVAAAVSGPVTVFEANSGKPAHQLKGHGFGTTAVAWQPGGNLLATAGQDGKVRLWDAATGAEATALDGGAAWVEQLAWNGSGTLLASAAGKNTRVWDAAGNLIRELPPQAGTVTDVAWRPVTRELAVLAYGAATICDPTAGTESVKRFEWKGSPLRLAWSPDGRVLAHGNQDSTVHFWYYESGADLQMYGYPAKVRELSWDFTSRFLATGGGPMVCIWDCGGPGGPEGTKPQMLEGHEENLTAVAYQARGYLLASAGLDGRVLLWQPANKKSPKVGEFRFDDTEATVLAWSPDDKSLAAGSGAGTVAVFRGG